MSALRLSKTYEQENLMIASKIQAVVLAAGKATRFKTKKSKLLFNICGRSMILYPLKELEALSS
jgi:bifunctional N-acetylglucosamine-1-phosphate-uridyltransferase/glucosamine-1-phosphate-acetyltransferase GlmU-like protein